MKKGGSSATGGFTIVETLIVLAVTSALLISAMLLINGRQNKTQFMVAINDYKQLIQQLINQTASGYYPNFNDYTCSKGASVGGLLTVTISNASAAEQGTNSDCVFLGRVMFFAKDINGQSAIKSYTIAGNALATGIADQIPMAIASGSNFNQTFNTADSPVNYAENGLTTYAMSYVSGGAAPSPTGTLAFLAGTGAGYTPQAGQSGALAQQLSLYTVKGTGITTGPKQVTDQIDGGTTLAPVNNFVPVDSATICMSSGSTNQSGLITITSNLDVTLTIMDGTTCA